jgi:PiT family inorganic phosphate transporter
MKLGFYLVGIYGAYALGANNVANTTGVFLKVGMLTPFTASLIGGLSIGVGVCTFSRRVMYTVGKRITDMSDLAALSAVLGQDITVHLFSWIGVPISSSQAIVGAVVGVGLVKTGKRVDFRTLGKIVLGWFATPAVSFVIAYAILQIANIYSM